MNEFNKVTTRVGLIMLVLALVLFTSGMVIYGFIASKASTPFVLIPPVSAIGYGCYAFVKKYHPKDEKKKNQSEEEE